MNYNPTQQVKMEMMSLLVVSLTVIVVTTLIFTINRNRKTRNPPGPRGLPFIGIFLQLKSPLFDYFWKMSKQYGPLCYMKLGSRPVLVANSSKMAEEVLKTQDLVFCSRPGLLGQRKLTYDCVNIAYAPYNDQWREMRKTSVLHLLSVKRVQANRDIREDEILRMVKQISKHASLSEEVNLTDMIMFTTSTMISRIAFGKRFEQGSAERKRFVHIISEFTSAVSGFYFTDYFPLLRWVDKLTGKVANLDRIAKEWDVFYQQLIDEHLSPDHMSKSATQEDVLDILLKLRKQESGSPNQFSLDDIKATLSDMYFASTDTISTATVWTFTALVKNPHAMKKAQAEIRQLLSSKNKEMVEEEDIKDDALPYLDAVIKEGLRHYTPLPLLVPRETMKTCTIGGYEVPAKTLVHVNAYAIAHDPEFWENPNEFLPERFLNNKKLKDMDIRGQDIELIPFGAGRRGCPAITMAMATVRIVLANFIYNFNWKMPNGLKNEEVDTQVSDGMTLHKKYPLCLIPSKFVQ